MLYEQIHQENLTAKIYATEEGDDVSFRIKVIDTDCNEVKYEGQDFDSYAEAYREARKKLKCFRI